MKTADITPLTEVYAVGDRFTPGPGVILSRDPWVHYNRLARRAGNGKEQTLRPSTPGEAGWGERRDIHDIPKAEERGLLCVCTWGGMPETEARATALPSLGRQILDVLTDAAAELGPDGRIPLPELPKAYQLAVIRPHDVHGTWAAHVEQEGARARRDVELAAAQAERQAAEAAARARILAMLGQDYPMPKLYHGSYVTGDRLDWRVLETLLNDYAAALRKD